MALTVTEVLMALGSWSLDLDYSESDKEALFRPDGNPRKLWALVYDENDALVYPPLPLLWGKPGKERIEIGGTSILWDLGLQGIGPIIDDREYLSDANKLDNPVFALDPPDSYWRRVAENSTWSIITGQAGNLGGLRADDTLEYDRKFPTRPGYSYRLTATVLGGTGRLRIRTIYDGTFYPPDLLDNGDFEDGPGLGWSAATNLEILPAGGRSGLYSLWINPIPKPQLIDNGDFADGSTGWTLGPSFSVASGGLITGEVERPQYIDDPNFLDGPGDWTMVSPNIGDIQIVNEPSEGFGGWTMRAGPVTQHQVFQNADFEYSHYTRRPPGAPAEDPPPHFSLSAPSEEEQSDEVAAYLRRYGYLRPSRPSLAGDSGVDPAEVTEALRSYQRFMGLRPTGRMNAETRRMMARPRCGVPDAVADGARTFVYIGTRWEGVSVLKWYLTDPAPFSQGDAAGAIVDAFSQWEPHVPFTFEETSVQTEAHIVFFRAAIDGVYNILAYAWQPPGPSEPLLGTNNGDVTFDAAENWFIDPDPGGGASDYLAVALHEIGHAIGLHHSDVSTAVMWPTSVNGRRTLDADDIAGIEYVYADIIDPVDPPPVPPAEDPATVIPYWYQSSTISDPDPGIFYRDPGGGLDDSQAATTDGVATADRVIKYLRADASDGTGVTSYDVTPGERYTYEVHVRAAPSTDGTAYVSLHIPHPTVPNRERWYVSHALEGEKVSDDVFRRLYIDLDIPANRYKVDALCEVHDNTTGYWAFDMAIMTRTRGNRAQIEYSTIPVVADTRYQLAADVRSDDDLQVGGVRVGVILQGSGQTDLVVDTDKGNTDFVWSRVALEVRPPTGYTTAKPFVAALDIIGAPLWVDLITFSKVENNIDVATHSAVAVVPDQRYLLSADVTAIDATRGTVAVGVTLSGFGLPDQDFEVSPGTLDNLKTKSISVEVRPPDGYTVAVPFVRSTDVEGGVFAIDNVFLTKSDNNSDSTTGTTFDVTPERTYRWVQAVRSGVNLQRGTVKLSVRCLRTGYDDVVFDSSAMDGTLGDWKFFDFSFTPPSGYTQVEPKIIGTDVEGDVWQLDEGSIRDTDTSTVVFDVTADDGALASPFVDSIAPEGAETVRLSIIAEDSSSGRSVLAVSLKRTDGPPATGDDIIADLLVHPDTGLPMGIAPGTINCPEVIPFDWWQIRMTPLAALAHYVDVISEPVREFRINPGLPPTIDVSTSPFVVRPIVLLPDDIDVEDVADPTADVTNRATVIEVIGAEVTTLSGQTLLITAKADVPGEVEYDINNNPIVRTRFVDDTTIDTFGYAAAFAADQALREAFPGMVVDAILTGTTTGLATARGELDVGDWLEVYEPESGIEDTTNPKTVEGMPVFPRVMRTVAREREHGPSFRVEMLRPDGSTFSLAVNHSERDATKLTLADRRLYDWEADPGGGATGAQYLRDRASKPR